MSVSFIYVLVAFKHMIKFYVVEPIIDFTFLLDNQTYEMKLHRGLFPSRINSKMAFLNMSLLLLFILVVSKTNTQAKLVYHNIEINGENLFLNDYLSGRHLFKNLLPVFLIGF